MTTYVYKSTTGFPVNIDNYIITPNPGLYSKYQIDALDTFIGSTLSRYDDGVLVTNDSNYPATFSLDSNNNVTGLVGPGGMEVDYLAAIGGRVASVTYSPSGQVATYSSGGVSYTVSYDASGRVQSVTDGTAVRTVAYNANGTVASII